MAVHTRGNQEIVVAFRPEFMGVYLDGMIDLHRIGFAPEEVALLGRITANPNAVGDMAERVNDIDTAGFGI